MIRVYRPGPTSFFMLLLALLLLAVVALPVFLVLVPLGIFGTWLRHRRALKHFREHHNTREARKHQEGLSPLIENQNIGAYRIRQNPQDPDVIEVIDEN